MDIKDKIKVIADRITALKLQVKTEESTKTAFIMPFIQMLGYDIFNPMEVVPEFVADIGIKKGEKIDYAILKDGKPTILIECKHWEQDLNVHEGQLLRYFHASKVKFGVLTNGILYRFYSDLVEPNKMDEKPFLEVDITEIKDNQIDEIKKFHKAYFDIESIISNATDLKYTNEIKNIITQEFNDPTADFVRFFAKQVYQYKLTQNVIDQFTILVQRSISQHISDLITERLKTALNKEKESNVKQEEKREISKEPAEPKIITTDEELEGFGIAKSILRQKVESKRINYRDFQGFFAVLLDDSIRKTICRFYFNDDKKFIAIPDENKKEVRFDISTLDDIYNFSEQLLDSVERLIKK
jgi:hypothetical protein